MPLERLAQDALEVRVSLSLDAVPPCPFCGQVSPLMTSAVNEDAAGGRVLYQSRLTCTNLGCSASVLANERSREGAQQEVIRRWTLRA